jgi:hypothetical protein
MRRPKLLICALVLATCLAAPGPAGALSRVVKDCNAHNQLTGHYTVGQLRTALATMPADVKEYTPCYQLIQNQLFRQLGKPVPGTGGAGSSNSGGSFISIPVLIAVIVVVLAGAGLALRAARRGGGGPPPPGSG